MGESAYLLHVCLVTKPNHTQAKNFFLTIVIKLQIIIIVTFFIYIFLGRILLFIQLQSVLHLFGITL